MESTNKKTPGKILGRNGFRYRQQYGLIIPCRDETHQQELFDRLKALGYMPKVVAV